MTTNKEFYTIKEAADALKVSVPTVRRWIEDNTIEARKIGGRWRIPSSEIDRLTV